MERIIEKFECNAPHERYFDFVQSTLKADGDFVKMSGLAKKYPFRSRFEHTKRVYLWAKRLLCAESCCDGIDKEAVLIAAIFHDVGYNRMNADGEHAKASADIFMEYVHGFGVEHENVDFIRYLVENHSDKSILREENTPMELIMLLEADLMDETGALSLVWDSMAEGGSDGAQSFRKTFEHMKKTRGLMEKEIMVTEYAKKVWSEKRALVEQFMTSLEYDLG